jgi:acyl dehydratase
MMRLIVDGILANSSSMGANAVDDVRWLVPVRPGDALTLRATVKETRVSRSRPELGFVTMLFEMFNQNGTQVMTLTSPLMLGTCAGRAA